jgi:hypothetical protein
MPSLILPRRRAALLSLAAALWLPALSACASEGPVAVSPVTLALIDRDAGQVLPVYRKHGRGHVAGRPGARYAIRLSNESGARVLVVLSVDGINVISGQTAGWNQTGYVLDPWRSFDITGWRKNDSTVAAFEFAALRDSYASRTGRPGDVGVIGMAVFAERPAPPPPAPFAPPVASAAPDSGNAAPPAAARAEARGLASRLQDSATDKLGTAHGAREASFSTRTGFERLSSTPQAVVELAYDSFANLVAAGVIPVRTAQNHPRAFPLQARDGDFVADPPGR